MNAARLLTRALVDPACVSDLDGPGWTALIAVARAELLIGSLAIRIEDQTLPDAVMRQMDDAREAARQGHILALWEAEMARRALAPLGITPVLLKGTAFVAAELEAGQGRSIGDLDILVPQKAIDMVADALRMAGWEWVKDDAYDQRYYRRWMHELPPMIHRDRDRMIDVHHTILPLTASPTPDPRAMIAESRVVAHGYRVLSPPDMVVHAAAHLLADGDLSGGLRNLWDIDRLLREFASPAFWNALAERAHHHELDDAVARALRLARSLYATPVPAWLAGRSRWTDYAYVRRLLARDGWGRPTRPLTRFFFYVRSHWIRMPLPLLARHLWIKARR